MSNDVVISTNDTAVRTHSAWLTVWQVKQLLGKIIADKVGVDVTAPHVTVQVTLRTNFSNNDADDARIMASVTVIEGDS